MELRKDDPIYYKIKMQDLMKQAIEEGLEIQVDVFLNGLNNETRIGFKAGNGDLAQVCIKPIKENENERN